MRSNAFFQPILAKVCTSGRVIDVMILPFFYPQRGFGATGPLAKTYSKFMAPTTVSVLEMTMGMGFPMGMGIPWDSHGNGNW